LQSTLILLVEHIAVALGAEFKIYLPQLMPQILRVLIHDTSKDRTVTVKVRDSQLVHACTFRVKEMGLCVYSLAVVSCTDKQETSSLILEEEYKLREFENKI
jgi:hypothetical protein